MRISVSALLRHAYLFPDQESDAFYPAESHAGGAAVSCGDGALGDREDSQEVARPDAFEEGDSRLLAHADYRSDHPQTCQTCPEKRFRRPSALLHMRRGGDESGGGEMPAGHPFPALDRLWHDGVRTAHRRQSAQVLQGALGRCTRDEYGGAHRRTQCGRHRRDTSQGRERHDGLLQEPGSHQGCLH